jgi:hypothetical protein
VLIGDEEGKVRHAVPSLLVIEWLGCHDHSAPPWSPPETVTFGGGPDGLPIGEEGVESPRYGSNQSGQGVGWGAAGVHTVKQQTEQNLAITDPLEGA